MQRFSEVNICTDISSTETTLPSFNRDFIYTSQCLVLKHQHIYWYLMYKEATNTLNIFWLNLLMLFSCAKPLLVSEQQVRMWTQPLMCFCRSKGNNNNRWKCVSKNIKLSQCQWDCIDANEFSGPGSVQWGDDLVLLCPAWSRCWPGNHSHFSSKLLFRKIVSLNPQPLSNSLLIAFNVNYPP